VRISFICPAMEPGRDGVADYVVRFVRALVERGHACQVISAADGHVARFDRGEPAAIGAEVVRVPFADFAAGRIHGAARAVAEFAPDWVSLQMVCYGFARRGLVFGTARRLDAIAVMGRRHVMWHELWIGEPKGSSLRERVIGAVQRRLLIDLSADWGAMVAHTSNPTYRELLARGGVAAGMLPLPSNIPVEATLPAVARERLLALLGQDARVDKPLLLAGVFGAVHPGWANEEWLDLLCAAARRRGRNLLLAQIGRAGAPGASLWRDFAARGADRARFVTIGECSPIDISVALQGFDIGIATSPWPLVGKSGTVAAMLEHGLPVVVPRGDWALREGVTPEPVEHPLLHRFDNRFLESLATDTLYRAPAVGDTTPYLSFIDSLR
jgi:hypothetical protein